MAFERDTHTIKRETPQIFELFSKFAVTTSRTAFKRHIVPSNALAFSFTLILPCAQDKDVAS